MSVNGVTSTQAAAAYSYSSTESVKTDTVKTENTSAESTKTENTSGTTPDKGVVYEPSTGASTVKKTYTPDTNLIKKMQADADARTAQLRSLVEKMMAGQADTYGKANDIWSFLRSGNYTVDPATKMQAQADMAEDGYWGVKQTSQRIFDFAQALAGDDVETMKKMQAAVEKGFEQAGAAWGGELPSISGETHEAVNKLFDDYYAKQGVGAMV